ncbi:hypothetical protein K470DRAFT_268509 [Piedraia hortae CBS 480.64]|uniref:USP domain-containing protein n=1 Tax=Piedraia hortae CBS 480.64 TaxID=1314780 RepID=A0A6A7C797_9PEZI|nr:hypothetical protein K470DRAFT_268509 [Piedraia hortae CBS 480.64]
MRRRSSWSDSNAEDLTASRSAISPRKLLFREYLNLGKVKDENIPSGMMYRVDGIVFRSGEYAEGGHFISFTRRHDRQGFNIADDNEYVGSLDNHLQEIIDDSKFDNFFEKGL